MTTIRLGLITKSRSVFDSFLGQIKDLFGEQISVVGYCLDEQSPVPLECDLCLISYAEIRELVSKLTKKKVIVAHRTLDIAKLSPVFDLKAGTRVLVVNNFKESTEETIELLQTMGVKHLELFPYYPKSGIHPGDVKVAITPGMSLLVPPTIDRVIDIGNRIIDISTFIELNVLCNLPMDRAKFLTARAVREILHLNMEQAKLVKNLKQVNKQMEIILDNINDGVIAVDHQWKIVSCNNYAKVLMKVPLDIDVRGQQLEHLVPGLRLETITSTGIPEVNGRWKMNDTKMLITKMPLFEENDLSGIILILKHAREVIKSAETSMGAGRNDGYVAKYNFSHIIFHSELMRQVIHTAEKMALTELPVLILGESGTGKELFAQAIHNASRRQKQPFVAINLAALPESLIESELFGYEEGAFTGARKAGKAGLFELADGGTIFLDEIGEISPQIQVKLLRVLEEKEIMRIGGTKIIPVDVRIIAATNQDIETMVKQGSFRRDFYFRLCVSPLVVPPLRNRRDEIIELSEYFFTKYYEVKVRIPRETLELMMAYDWPGNVRELKEMIRFCTQLGRDEDESLEMFYQIVSRLVHKKSAESVPAGSGSRWDNLLIAGNVNEFLIILEELLKARQKGERIGRESLQRKLVLRGICLSEQQVRTRLSSLQKFGCIVSGSGRQGSIITAEGERLFHDLQKLEGK